VKRVAAVYAPLSVVGLEIEYAVVDAALRPACVVEDAFRAAYGRPTSDLSFGRVGFSNELAAHVLEMKTMRPSGDLGQIEDDLHGGVRYFSALLRDRFGMRLLPTGMHPFMKPSDTRLWSRGGGAVYEAYARTFDLRAHGWLYIQSTHVNLPFGRTDRDLVDLYNAVGCLLPYLPAVAASSPVVEGRARRHADNRLMYYRTNQARIPQITGNVVPEFLDAVGQYRTSVLQPIYRALGETPGAGALRHEWVNSRGAILRFQRRALEVRILDVQECVRMDVALAAFVRAALRWLMRALREGEVLLPEHGMLVADLARVITDGRAARVRASHLGPGARSDRRAGDVLAFVLARSRREATPDERPLLRLVGNRLARGSLSEMMRARLRGGSGGTARRRLIALYEELIAALESNRPWAG
jgi:carboxylate-amine ligase